MQEQPGVPNSCFVALCEIISRRGAEARSVCAAARALGQWRQRIPRSLHEKLKIAAAREGVSLNAYVANVLAERMGMVG